VFFRKKGKYTAVEGYNRISRLIEDRQREMSQELSADDELDEDSVLLSREPPVPERPAPSFAEDVGPVAPVRPTSPPPPSPSAMEPPIMEEQSQPPVSPLPAPERRIPFQFAPHSEPAPASTPAPPTSPANVLPEVPATPRMVVPDLTTQPLNGSFVAAEAVWEGKLVTNGNLRVEGTMHGEIETPASVVVAANAHLDGSIRAGSIVVAGEVEGKVECIDRLEVLPGGSARGEIETRTLVVHEGAFIDSRFQMRTTQQTTRG
jgi:cytoskeletal protein CcmA (bactofilin family)